MLGPLALPRAGRTRQSHAVESMLTTLKANHMTPHGPLREEHQVLTPGLEGLRHVRASQPRASLSLHRRVPMSPPAVLQAEEACYPSLRSRGALAIDMHERDRAPIAGRGRPTRWGDKQPAAATLPSPRGRDQLMEASGHDRPGTRPGQAG